jgi:hypothetical protein
MLRTTMNKDYFLELFDAAEAFGIEVEGHREYSFTFTIISFRLTEHFINRHRDWSRSLRDGFGLYSSEEDGG